VEKKEITNHLASREANKQQQQQQQQLRKSRRRPGVEYHRIEKR
jgi:hypothetical protein